jgi:hypothetical protein
MLTDAWEPHTALAVCPRLTPRVNHGWSRTDRDELQVGPDRDRCLRSRVPGTLRGQT